MKNSRKSAVLVADPVLPAPTTLGLQQAQQFVVANSLADQRVTPSTERSPNPEDERFRAFLSSNLPPLQAPAALAKRIRNIGLMHE